MQAHIMSLHPWPLGWGQKGKFFSPLVRSHVAHQIKGNGVLIMIVHEIKIFF